MYYNLENGLTSMYSVYECLLILVFTVPILTMRVIADERKQKTDQLILTAPISVEKIVIGKFLALLTIFAIPVLIIWHGIYKYIGALSLWNDIYCHRNIYIIDY